MESFAETWISHSTADNSDLVTSQTNEITPAKSSALFEDKIKRKHWNLNASASNVKEKRPKNPRINKSFRVKTKAQQVKCNYEVALKLHKLWCEYILSDVLVANNITTTTEKLVKADLNGAKIKILQSSCFSFVGIEGICVQERTNSLVIVSEDNQTRIIPKKQCNFQVSVPDRLQFTIYGSQFCVRSAERSVKKFKSKPTVDLE